MKTTKANIIIALAKAIQQEHNDFNMVDLSDFDYMTDYWKVEDTVEAKIHDLYLEIGKVLKNQDIDN